MNAPALKAKGWEAVETEKAPLPEERLASIVSYFEERGSPFGWPVKNGVTVELGTHTWKSSKEVNAASYNIPNVTTIVYAFPHNLMVTRGRHAGKRYVRRRFLHTKAQTDTLPGVDIPKAGQYYQSGSSGYYGTTYEEMALKVKNDPTVPVHFFEGEPAWFCVTWNWKEYGAFPIAVTGAWSGDCENLSDWVWKDRVVYMTPDRDDPSAADGMTENVRNGWARHAQQRIDAGAVVKFLILQQTAAGKASAADALKIPEAEREKGWGKMGMDHYALAGGTWSELQSVEAASTPESTAKEDVVARINKDWAYDAKGDCMVSRIDPGWIMRPDGWNRYMKNQKSVEQEGDKWRTTQHSELWWGSEARAQFKRTDWMPDEPPGVIIDEALNTWHEPEFLKHSPLVTLEVILWFERHVLAMAGNDQDLANHFRMWIVQMISEPMRRPPYMVSLYGPLQGIGKSFLGQFIAKAIGPKMATSNLKKEEVTTGFFGERFANRLFVNMGDIYLQHRAEFMDRFGPLVTDTQMNLRRLNANPVTVEARFRILNSANKAFSLMTEFDRRSLVLGSNVPPNVLPGEKDMLVRAAEYQTQFLRLALATIPDGGNINWPYVSGIMHHLIKETKIDDNVLFGFPPKTDAFYSLCEQSQTMNQSYAQPLIGALAGLEVIALSKSAMMVALGGIIKAEHIGTIYNELHDHFKVSVCRGESPPRINISGIGQVVIFGKKVPTKRDKSGRLVAELDATDVRLALKNAHDRMKAALDNRENAKY